jgi:hypothetical protein
MAERKEGQAEKNLLICIAGKPQKANRYTYKIVT